MVFQILWGEYHSCVGRLFVVQSQFEANSAKAPAPAANKAGRLSARSIHAQRGKAKRGIQITSRPGTRKEPKAGRYFAMRAWTQDSLPTAKRKATMPMAYTSQRTLGGRF